MGDNIYLGDRNGVRTPMQWSADRNAGFSRANPQRLYLPVNIDPEYHYEAVNVEAQQNNSHSLLWLTKRLIQQRKQFQAFGRGTLEFLYPSNRKVLAFIRQFEDETRAGRRQPLALRAVLSNSIWPAFKAGCRWKSSAAAEIPHHHRKSLPAVARPARVLLVPSAAAERRRRSRSTSAARRRSCRSSR